ncbi:D-alanine--D-alanine ligase [Plantactinospora sp. S1510]|uniref:D-alanine--D-alanine ligase n=1 Tax=Plantactinospora alkalitolerans TaxID=2789879 RepID=A0ABS0H211_9ACTN|nr:D-alanine--D-alanine ligase family protein [Plantactinospora alkalitolerans]MBF9132389.1 D-alanine--D-alanine ligase [Plantactinospora alkalitolerans]
MSEAPIRVAVISGGRSGEHQVSRRSASSVLANLDPARYRPESVVITRTGQWVFGTDAPVSVFEAVDRLRTVDVIFPTLHGPYGEDGTLQSVLELTGVPYVGNGVLASAAGMDKEFTKKLLAAEGVPVADAVVSRPTDPDGVPAEADLRRLGLPVFVKPARAGSSLGVTRVTRWEDLPAALEWARASDPKVLVEEAVPGREIDLAVLEHPDGRLSVGPPLEIRVAGERSFFDFDAKYEDPETVFEIPARLDDAVAAELADLAVRAFRALGCAGLARIDFFLRDGVTPVLNEINTFPGFTPVSQYPRIWQVAGLDYPELLDVLVENALARRTERSGERRVSARRPGRSG